MAAMSEPLRPIPLAELRLLPEGRRWQVEQRIDGLDSLTAVQGQLHAVHHGTALEVSAEAETIVTLCCDRCLQHYNHALRAEVHELVELRGHDHAGGPHADLEELSLELARDGMPEGADLDDRLDPAGSFDPQRWLFEQLNLRLPLVNRCGDDCPGPATWSSEPAGGDPRWAALARLGLGGSEAASGGRPGSGLDASARGDAASDRGASADPASGSPAGSDRPMGPQHDPEA